MRDYVAPSVHFLVAENCLRRPALLHEDHAEGKVSASAAPISRFSSSSSVRLDITSIVVVSE